MNFKPLSDDIYLLGLLKSGDESAFDVIYDTYAELLARKLETLVKLPDIVEEIHQDIFIRFWNHRNNIDDDTNIKAYLFTIARNLVIDFYRKAAKDRVLQLELREHIKWSYDHIEPLIHAKETSDLLEMIISQLPQRRQQVFRMIKIDGKSYAETAQYFGVSISTVKDHMARASRFIKSYLHTHHPDILFYIATAIVFLI